MSRSTRGLSATHPEIAADWDTARNAPLDVDSVCATSKDRVWWRCPAGHSYQVSIYTRVRTGGCKVCRRPLHGEAIRRAKLAKGTKLSDARPDLLAQWDSERNDIGPDEISEKSHRLVWWRCDEGHVWQSTPQRRARGDGCPICSRVGAGDRVRAWRLRSAGISLAQAHPDLMGEWVFEANDKDPAALTPKSNYKAHWRCRYGHEWDASVTNRTHNLSGCPFCTSQTSKLEIFLLCELRAVFSEVEWRRKFDGIECDIFIPELGVAVEVDGDYWHRSKAAADQRKTAFLESQGFDTIRVRDHRLPQVTGRVIKYETPLDMMHACTMLLEEIGRLHPGDAIRRYLEKGRQQHEPEYREMIARLPAPPAGASLLDLYPKIAAQWDLATNGPLTPELFSGGSEQRVGWVCPEGHRWQATIKNRTRRGSGCPECNRAQASERTRRRLAHKIGSLASATPSYLSMWDHEANGDLAPSDLAATSGHPVRWRCSIGHSFVKSPAQMFKNPTCPDCRALSSLHPEIAAEWQPERNGQLTPASVTPGSGRRVWWKCSAGHEWQAVIASRVSGSGCPVCFEKRRCLDATAAAARRTRQSLSEYAPEWLSEWQASRNVGADPADVLTTSDVPYWWLCDNGHLFQRSPSQRSRNSRCPVCTRLARAETVRKTKLARTGSLLDNYPEIAAEWHPRRNDTLRPHELASNSHRRVWWLCPKGHEWEQTPNHRVTLAKRGSAFTCPDCARANRAVSRPNNGFQQTPLRGAAEATDVRQT